MKRLLSAAALAAFAVFATTSAASAASFFADLSGANEVPPVATAATGNASFLTSDDGLTLFYTLQTQGLTDTLAAHIHLGQPGVNGGVVAFLFNAGGTPVTVDGLLSSGGLTAADLTGALAGQPLSALLTELEAGNAYVNAHTVANMGGEIRGQIFEPGETPPPPCGTLAPGASAGASAALSLAALGLFGLVWALRRRT